VSHGASEKTAPQLAVSIAKVAGVRTASIRIHRERAVVTGLHSFAILDKPFAPNSADMISSFVFYSPGTKYVMEPPSEK
jgi:hypothetical protein